MGKGHKKEYFDEQKIKNRHAIRDPQILIKESLSKKNNQFYKIAKIK